MKAEKNIILASASPRRRELLEQIGLAFTVEPADTDEKTDIAEPDAYVAELSKRKAAAVLKNHGDSVVISADTVVYSDGKILNKPSDADDARRMLRGLSGKKHTVYTGLTVADSNGMTTKVSETAVFFRRLSDNDIENYIKTGEYADKAGAYGIQGYAARFAERIEGCYFNVVGLPLSLLDGILTEKGIG